MQGKYLDVCEILGDRPLLSSIVRESSASAQRLVVTAWAAVDGCQLRVLRYILESLCQVVMLLPRASSACTKDISTA
jgi:hypothetical protein